MSRPIPAADLAGQIARRLTKPQRKVLAEVPAGLVRRGELLSTRRTSYVSGWTPSAVTTTARALIRHGLIQRGEREPGTWHSIYTLTSTGRAVLDHLTAEAKS